ncbi:PH and SEC7 domain-containing protein 4-like, partial [Pezoporus wallicus]|uniref:PH and SEC7 domain-containing protein 4-like n=1 Tax=Pezoporus wallicus TaxID=35540 RepID=UPI0025501402
PAQRPPSPTDAPQQPLGAGSPPPSPPRGSPLPGHGSAPGPPPHQELPPETPAEPPPSAQGSPPGGSRSHARLLASRLFRLDGVRRSEVAAFLRRGDGFSAMVAQEYLEWFQFGGGRSWTRRSGSDGGAEMGAATERGGIRGGG